MAVVLIKKQVTLVQQKVFIYGIIPMVVLFLFFSIHTAFTLAEIGNNEDVSTYEGAPITVTTASYFSGDIVVTGNDDLSGTVVIPAGSNGIEVVFERGFTQAPSIALEITQEHDIDKYYVEDVTSQGFTVIIDPIQTTKTTFKYKATDSKSNPFNVTNNTESNASVRVEDNEVDVLKVATEN